MKKVIIISVIALLSLTAMAQDQKVAVFDPAGNAESAIKEIIREEISSIIVNTGRFTVLERQLINKVLEENKFQSGGLVDDSQISEIGKRMGANLVFVTSLSQIGTNYHISCKLIDVQTARIEKQRTAQTIKGSSDLITTIQKMVSEMFAQSVKTSENIKQETVPQKNTSISQNVFNSNISFSEFKTQLKVEKKAMLAGNSLALASYKKHRAEKGVGWTFFALGTATVIGGTCMILNEYGIWNYVYWMSSWTEWGGIIMLSTGGAVFITGVGLLIASGKDLKASYNFYTKGSKTACTFNVTPLVSPKFQGIGLSLKF